MIKYLVLAIPLLTGCGKLYHCDDPNKPNTVVCIPDQSTPDGCEGEGLHTYYVWLLSDDCTSDNQQSFCAADDASAQTYVDTNFSDVTHGAPSLDGHATEPTLVTMCGSNPDDPDKCILGSSDESMGTTFWHFTDDQIPQCEMNLDSGCTKWVPLDPQTGSCPAAS
jgi:hypothetical protein